MHKQIRVLLPQMLLTLAALTVYMPDSYAQKGYIDTVISTCLAYNGTQPANTGCTLCHAPSPASKATRKDPEWTWWQNQSTQITKFCPEQTNQAPNGVINTPVNNAIFNLDSTGTAKVDFNGTGSDPDNHTPLTYAWNFGGAAASSTGQTPSVIFNTAGTYTITFTVTDGLGRADPTPAAITLTVKDPNANQAPDGAINSPASNSAIKVGDSLAFAGTGSDPDNNTPLSYAWNFGGSATNSTAQTPGNVTFNKAGIYSVTLTVTDSKGLNDPTPATRTVTVGTTASACTDQDNDKFSPVGGVCGPIDCNDFVASINPGAIEACSDGIDNDCNGDKDGNDAHCKGADCVAQLLNKIEIVSANWEQEDRKLSVKGLSPTSGAVVKLSDALTGTVLGTTTVKKAGDDSKITHLEWSFELEHLAMAPCRIRAEITGRSGERDVAYAPANCSGKPAATNNPPVANADSVTTKQKVPVKITVLANDTDLDKDRLSIIVFTQPGHGVVTKDGEILVYTPKSDFTGSDNFTYTISDGHGGTATAKVSVTVQKAQSTAIKAVIGTAAWNSSDKKLLVSGTGAVEDASVKLLNAKTKAVLGNTKAEDDGKWKITIEKPSVVPCKVRVEITKDIQTGFAEKSVDKAPKTCK